jgi:hypothetical protein
VRALLILGMVFNLIACAALGSFALEALSPDKGGINTEIIVGDKEQTLGTNQDVNANNIGKVVGVNDNSVAVATAKDVSVVNQNYPGWLILLLLVGNVLFLCLPTPTTMWKYFRRNK